VLISGEVGEFATVAALQHMVKDHGTWYYEVEVCSAEGGVQVRRL
jgi:hypothetical protein